MFRIIYSIGLNVAATLIVSVAMGITAVLIPIALERSNLASAVTGTILSLESVSALIICIFLSQILRMIGTRWGLILSTCIRVPAVIGIIFTSNVNIWVPLIFIYGVGCFTFLILLQTWINALPITKNRGLVVSLYSTSISIGLALGPIVLNLIENYQEYFIEKYSVWIDSIIKTLTSMIGIDIDLGIELSEVSLVHCQFGVAALLNLLALLPVLLSLPLIPNFRFKKTSNIWRMILNCKGYMFAIAMGGVSIFGVSAFITIYGIRNGLALEDAALLLTAFMLGSLFLEVPLAWLSDYFDRRYMIVICAFLSMSCAVYLPIAIYETYQAWGLLFLWGGVIGAIYSVVLAHLGDRFAGEELVSANAGYSLMDSLGGTLGILLIGFAMQTLGSDGLSYVIMFASILYFSFAVTRYRVT